MNFEKLVFSNPSQTILETFPSTSTPLPTMRENKPHSTGTIPKTFNQQLNLERELHHLERWLQFFSKLLDAINHDSFVSNPHAWEDQYISSIDFKSTFFKDKDLDNINNIKINFKYATDVKSDHYDKNAPYIHKISPYY